MATPTHPARVMNRLLFAILWCAGAAPVKLREGKPDGGYPRERGDVPGWVMITLVTNT